MIVNGEVDITYLVYRGMTLSYLGVRVIFIRIFAAFMVVYAFWSIVIEDVPTNLLVVIPVAIVIFAVPELIAAVGWLVQRGHFAGRNMYSITAAGIDAGAPGGTRQMAWADVARVRRGRHAWTIRRAGAPFQPLVVPKAAFSPEDQRRVTDFFLRHPEFAG